jgi:DNA-binding NarL/FixJ family response regulator
MVQSAVTTATSYSPADLPLRMASASASATADATNTICVAWIDVSCLTRECMTQAVATAQRLFIIVPFASVYDCMQHSGRKLDLIVYHAHDTDAANVADIKTLREAFSNTQLVVLSDVTTLDPTIIREVLMKGASGFILTNKTGLHMMVSAIGLVASGGTFVPKEFLFVDRAVDDQAEARRASRSTQLTEREREVLALVKQGKPNKLIAHSLNVSQATAKVHVRNLMRKMGATNRTQAAMNADHHLRPALAA